MKPLRLALIHSPTLLDPVQRSLYGFAAYDVPEFTIVEHLVKPKNGMYDFDLRGFKGRVDLVIHEDMRVWGTYGERQSRPPTAFRVLDSTECDKHYQKRREQAARADIILLDIDRTERFSDLKRPIVRSGFGLDERLFSGDPLGERDIDVAFLCGVNRSLVRPALERYLRDLCLRRGWSYVAGRPPVEEYVRLLHCTKVMVAHNRTPRTRSGRCFETLAGGACLLASPIPAVEGEDFRADTHYVSFEGLPDDSVDPGPECEFGPDDLPDLSTKLDLLLQFGDWRDYAFRGQKYVLDNFTWTKRAAALRAELEKVL